MASERASRRDKATRTSHGDKDASEVRVLEVILVGQASDWQKSAEEGRTWNEIPRSTYSRTRKEVSGRCGKTEAAHTTGQNLELREQRQYEKRARTSRMLNMVNKQSRY